MFNLAMQRLAQSLQKGAPLLQNKTGKDSGKFAGGAIGNYGEGIKRAYQRGAVKAGSSPGLLGRQISGGAEAGNKLLADVASLISGTPGYDKIQSQGMASFTPNVQHDMLTRLALPSLAKKKGYSNIVTFKGDETGTALLNEKGVKKLSGNEYAATRAKDAVRPNATHYRQTPQGFEQISHKQLIKDTFNDFKNLYDQRHGKNLQINPNLTADNETFLDAIPHTLKGGGQISGQQARYFLNEYSNRPIVGQPIKDFLGGNPTDEQIIEFIRNNF